MVIMKSVEFLFVLLVLPSLFAITLIAEGLSKVLRKESGWVSIGLGVVFLSAVVTAYFVILR